jgi:hypothetical protein
LKKAKGLLNAHDLRQGEAVTHSFRSRRVLLD